MCGIVGSMALGKLPERQEKLRQESMIFLTTELLQLTQARGTDATGVSMMFNDGNFMGLKMGISSPEFISRFGGAKTDFEGFIKLWREYEHPVKTYLGHCRKTSIGSSKDNSNNHPIKVGNIVGIHNGTLTNHDTVFEKLDCKRDGDVDSEAIIRMLHFYTRKGTDPFTPEMLKEVCLRLQGTYSVIAYNADNPNQVATFRDGRPAHVALVRPLNLLLMASDEAYIKQVLYRYNKHSKIYLSRIKFPILMKNDIDYKNMADDTCAVFDLTNKVDKDTTVDDLFEDEKVPRLDKIWKKTITYNRGNTHNASRSTHGANTGNKDTDQTKGKKEEENKAKKDDEKGDKEVKGKIWNKELNEFKDVDVEQEEKAKKIKAVEIAPNGSLVHMDEEGKKETIKPATTDKDNEEQAATDKDDGINLKEVPKEDVNKLMGNTADIQDEPVDYSDVETAVINPSTGETQDSEKKVDRVTVEVNAKVDPAAMEAATKAAAVQPKFENDEEVLEELDIDDGEKLRNLQLFALANRLSKVLFRKIYYKGYVKAKEGDDKLARAGDRIKTLKIIIKIFMKAFRATSHNNSWKEQHLMEASDEATDLTIESMNRVFSIGDFRNSAELRYIRDKCTKFKRQLYTK